MVIIVSSEDLQLVKNLSKRLKIDNILLEFGNFHKNKLKNEIEKLKEFDNVIVHTYLYEVIEEIELSVEDVEFYGFRNGIEIHFLKEQLHNILDSYLEIR